MDVDKNTAPKSIAILRLAALGDICMTVPLVHALREKFPHTKIYWIIAQPMTSLIEGLDGVEFIRINKPKNFSGYRQIYRQLRQYSFDILLVPQASWRSNMICPLIKAKVKYGYGKLHSRDMQRLFVHRTVPAIREHLVDSFLRFAEILGAEMKKPVWRLPLSETDFEWAKQQLGEDRFVAICPTASKSERNWNFDRYVDVIKELQQRWQFNVVLIGGREPTAMEASQRIATGLHHQCLDLTGKSSLKQLAAVLSFCDVLIAPDTGPAHIANAVRTPVVGLYAVAPPEKTGPYYSLPWVVNKFPEAVKTILKKDPQKISWRQRVHTPEAMQLIQVRDVVEKCEALFKTLNMPEVATTHPEKDITLL